jgi:FkbM family methyltransferase
MAEPFDFLDADVVAAHAERIAAEVLEAARAGQLAIVGAAGLPQKCARALRELGGEPACFIEYDPCFWGQEVAGLTVFGPDEAFRKLGRDALVVAGVWSPKHKYADTRDWLCVHGFKRVLPVGAVFWAAAEQLGAHYQLAPPHVFAAQREAIEAVDAALADEESRRQFRGHLRWRVTLDPSTIPEPDRQRVYFDPALLALPEEAVVADCGAFDGDSLRVFLRWNASRFAAFHAFEPDPVSYARLNAYVESLPSCVRSSVLPAQLALGAAAGAIQVAGTGKPGSHAGTEGATVPVLRLDEVFADSPIHYLKLDIEGAEWEALEGAWPLVARDRPVLGVAVYHKPDDIFTLPAAIIVRTPDYEYFMRSHDDDGIDFVFYAVPKERRPAHAAAGGQVGRSR